jgi:hypothetical protein
MFMRKNDLIEKKAAEVQNCIVHCSNHEPMVDGDILWITANSISVQDLMSVSGARSALGEWHKS